MLPPRQIAPLVCIACCLLLSAGVSAQPAQEPGAQAPAAAPPPARPPQVDELLKQGIEAFGLARFDDARGLLEQARAATKDPGRLGRVHLYFGLIEAVSGSRAKARGHFAMALSHDASLKLDPANFKQELVALLEQVRAQLRGQLLVHAATRPAQVLVDGKPAGPLPLVAQLLIGTHQVEIRAPDGRLLHSATVMVRPGRTARVVSPAAPPPTAARTSQPVNRAAPEARPAPRRRRLLTWIAAGASAALLGTGLGLGISSSVDHGQWEDACRSSQGIQSCVALARSIEDRDLAANVMFAVGGTLAATAVVLYFFEGRRGPEGRRRAPRAAPGPRVVPVVSPTGAGAALELSF